MTSTDEAPDVKATTVTAIIALVGAVGLGPASRGAELAPQPQVRSEMLVSTSWLQEHLNDADLVVLYVGRDRSAYDTGHIPNARFLALDELVEQHKDSLNDLPPAETLQSVFESLGVSDDSRIVLVGEGGGLLAARAYYTLDYLGHADRASLLDGGMERWKAEGRPIDDRIEHVTAAHFTPHLQSDVVVTTFQMREITREVTNGDGNYVLLDSRPPREFDGTVMSEAVPKAGHLPGAQSLYWKTLLQSEAISALQDPAQLRQAFMRAGAVSDKVVVTYCRTGMQSSFTYFVAKYLGYRAAMYDGSVYEWVNRAGYDLVTAKPALK